MKNVFVSGSFDNLNSRHMRFLHEASHLGRLHVLLWSDEDAMAIDGKAPQFPQDERLYLLRSIRYTEQAILSAGHSAVQVRSLLESNTPNLWVVDEKERSGIDRTSPIPSIACTSLTADDLAGFPVLEDTENNPAPSPRKKVIVTGCYDWFHSGHVRFFEEVAELGDLYVVAGHDANIRLLKGEGHPMFPEAERRYMVQSIRYVTRALVSTGNGWLDAEPEIRIIKPDIYAVNEDGDKPEKRDFCEKHGIKYVVLKRTPKEGLTRRSSTDLRGF